MKNESPGHKNDQDFFYNKEREGDNMKKIPVIIDCDPGVDDTLALMLANQIETFELLAVTTVAGNAPLAYTFKNGRNVMDYIGAKVPVYKGA